MKTERGVKLNEAASAAGKVFDPTGQFFVHIDDDETEATVEFKSGSGVVDVEVTINASYDED